MPTEYHRSSQQGNHREAAAHYTNAIRVLKEQPETPQRDLEEAELQIPLATSLVPAQGFGKKRLRRQ